jgi:hypothetical protein
MTYPQLLADIYRRYEDLLRTWNQACDEQENAGAMVFLPDNYSTAHAFDQVHYAFWTTPEIQAYLKAGGQADDGFVELLLDLDFGEEFLVMIVEFLGNENRHAVHVHKITKVGLN